MHILEVLLEESLLMGVEGQKIFEMMAVKEYFL